MPNATERADEIGEATGGGGPAPAAAATFPADPTAFSGKARDLQALRDSLVDAATVSGGLWLSYLFVFFYLAIAAGGVSHRDMFFENPVKLPFLNVDLPLIGFFVLGPALFLIVHAYTLLHYVLLAGKIGAFHAELQEQIPDRDTSARLRRQLPSNVFVQFLAGPREVRTGAMGFMLRLIAQITLVAGPIALLVFFQLQFLPYHYEAISWWQRLAVVADLVLLWVLWPSVARSSPTSLRWYFRRGKVAAGLLASLLPVLLVFTVATFPGEWLEETLPELRFVPTSWDLSERASPHELLVAGKVDFVARRPKSLWSNRLVLPGIEVIDHAKLDTEVKISALPLTVSLRGRHLEGAVLPGAVLRKVDFTGARLTDAVLRNADLREAKFGCDETGSGRKCADLRGALLDNAQLQGAILAFAQLQGASFNGAQFQGAWLAGAQLQGASSFFAAFEGASFETAELQGATLAGARLQGAVFYGAQLQGAMFNGAQLQGAMLSGAQLKGASLAHVFVWRADTQNTNAAGALVIAPEMGPRYSDENCPESCEWSADTFARLKRFIEMRLPAGSRRDGDLGALALIAKLDPATQLPVQPDPWADLERNSPPQADYERILASILRDTGCDTKGAPYVIHGLLPSLDDRFASGSAEKADLAAAFVDEAHCPGARGLSERDKSALQKIRNAAPPSAVYTPAPRSRNAAQVLPR